MRTLTSTFSVTLFLLLIGIGDAAAQRLGGLQVESTPGVEVRVRDAVQSAVARVGASGKWSWVDTSKMRGQMSSATRDCFTPTCLVEVGKQTGADGGIRVRLSGEAQIFDWTIDVYDLHTGKLAASEKGACELCGITEVRTEFEKTARAAVAAAKVTTKKPIAQRPRPQPSADPEPEPEPDPAREAEPAAPPSADELPPLGDPTAGLVMVEIVATPPDTVISMGGQEIGRGEVTVSLEHGSYEVQFAREGYGGLKETLMVGPQTPDKAFMRVHLARTDPDPVIVQRGDGPLDRLGKRRKTYGIIGLAGGGVLLATGIWLNAIDGHPTCDDAAGNCPRLYETSVAAFTTTLVGGVLATGGAVLLAWELLSPREETEPRTARVVPFVGDRSAGIGLVGRF